MWPFKEKVKIKIICCLCKNELKDNERLCAYNTITGKGDDYFCNNHKIKEIHAKCKKEDYNELYNGYGERFRVQ